MANVCQCHVTCIRITDRWQKRREMSFNTSGHWPRISNFDNVTEHPVYMYTKSKWEKKNRCCHPETPVIICLG